MRWGVGSLAVLSLACLLHAETAAERLAKIRKLTFQPSECYRIRDLFFEREDLKLSFSDGYLIFAAPVEGKTLAALFLSTTQAGEGNLVLMPPTPSERQSLSRFLGTPVLEEKLTTALMFFTDDTAGVLKNAILENPFNHPDADAGEKLAADWTSVARELMSGYALRMLADSYQPDLSGNGFFAAALNGVKVGTFDVLVDPWREEQVTAGQIGRKDNLRFYDTWTSFPGRSYRQNQKKPLVDSALLSDYQIDATLASDLGMSVTCRAKLETGPITGRSVAFELSSQMKVSRVLFDGRPVEFLQDEPLDSSGAHRRGNNVLLLALEQAPAPASRHEVEFQYQGNVITDAAGVYFVGARGNWYPIHGAPYTQFDIVFHYPKKLTLVATGRQVESSTAGNITTARWKSDALIRMAGFNLGEYASATVHSGDYTVEVCANKKEPGQPVTQQPMLPRNGLRAVVDSPGFYDLASRGGVAASPAIHLDKLAEDSARAMDFFVSRFGPPPVRQLIISPIPGLSGEGFPGLVYLSSLSYYDPEDQPQRLSPTARLFYSEQLRAHEIAHQWWGNLLSPATYHDEWLTESLADYSSLLYLEQTKGARVLQELLTQYKNDLLARPDAGDTVEGLGAIVLGSRLRTSRLPAARQIIVYQKGAWVLHMLRQIMGDEKFFAMLRELCDSYKYRNLTTEQFRLLAAKFIPRDSPDPLLENFFEQWVYSTGIPTLKLEYRVTAKERGFRLSGFVHQSGVAEDFIMAVPVEVQLPGAAGKMELRAQAGGGDATFAATLPQRPVRVSLDPKETILAIKQ